MNTRADRASALGLALPMVFHLPIPAGGLTQGARQHLAHLYSGILAASGTTTRVWQKMRLSMGF